MPRPQNEKENLQFVQELAEVDGPFESPININFLDLTKLELPPLCWNRSEIQPKKMKLTNTGHTVILSGRWNRERPYLTGGPLEGNYVFSQVHFHWGPDNCKGSEHSVCGEKFPLEMHVAHFKTEYSTQECALQEKDGMVVLVYLFKLQDEPNASLRRLINALLCIQEASTSVSIDPRPILSLCNPFTDDYFMYWGSVVTSTCAHILLWIICREPFGISRDQMEEFRKIMDCTQRPIQRNNRDTQPLHGRNVFHVNPSRCMDKPLLPIKKIVGCFCSDANDQRENGDSKRRSSSRACCCNKGQSQEEIEGKESKKSCPSNQPEGIRNKQMVYAVQHATIHSNTIFRKHYHTEDNTVQKSKKEEPEVTEKQEVSQSCCFLPIKQCKESKNEKDACKDKNKTRERKKSYDSVKALSNIIDSLEALKNHTYKKLQELDSIGSEIKELKKHCQDTNEQRWLRKMEKIITRQRRYTLRTSRCCFSELKRLAKEYNIDKVLEGKMIPSTEEEKSIFKRENELQELNVNSNTNESRLTCYNVYKQEKFSKKAQKLIKSFFEDIQENEEAQQEVRRDLEMRKMSTWKLEDEMSRTQISSVDESKVFITQQMFNLGDFGNRFFTEIPAEEKEAKEVEVQKDDKENDEEEIYKNEKGDKVIPLHRTDVIIKFKNKKKMKKSSSSSSTSKMDSNEVEVKLKKKASKQKNKDKNKKVQKKNAKTQHVSCSSEEVSEDETKAVVFSQRKSRKDIWEDRSITSVRPATNSSKKKKSTNEKNIKRKLDHVKKEASKREIETVVEKIEALSEKSYSDKYLLPEKTQISPERKKIKLDKKENHMDIFTVCEDCSSVKNDDDDDDKITVIEYKVSSPKERGDSVRRNKTLTPVEFNQEIEKLVEVTDEQDKRSWTAPSSKTRDDSDDKTVLLTQPQSLDKCIQRRATSPLLFYQSSKKKNFVKGSRSYRYEIHNHESPKTFIENWSQEDPLPNIEKYHFLEQELKDEQLQESDSNDSNFEKLSKMAKSDMTVFSIRSSDNEELRKEGKSRTMSAESFNSTKTIHKKRRRHRQIHKNQKSQSAVRMLGTIESSRLEFSNLTEDEQLQIISANVASFVKQKLLEHKRFIESKENQNQLTFGEVEEAVLKELKAIGESKNEEEDTDTLENQWSTAALNVPSVKEIEKEDEKEPEPKPEAETKTTPPVKPVRNFIKKNKLLAGKYKRKIPVKKPDGPKKIIKSQPAKSTEPATSSDWNKSPVRVVKPHACTPILKSPQEKARDRSASLQKAGQRTSSAKSPVIPKPTENNKNPTVNKESFKFQPTVPSAVQKIPKPKKRWIPTYTLTSYLHTPLEVVENQNRKFLIDKEDQAQKFDLNTNDLEYLIKLEMCINNEIAANVENSMNYVQTILSQDYNGTAIIEKPPIKDSFNIFDPVNNGILLVKLNDCESLTDRQTNATDCETSETRYSCRRLKKVKSKRRRIKKKWSALNRRQDSEDRSESNSGNSSDLDTKRTEKSDSDNKDVSKILKKYIYHLGRGEESNINLTEKKKQQVDEEITNFKPHLRKRKEKLLLSGEMKEKLLEVLTEEMKREIEDKEKKEVASSPERNSVKTEETTECECDRMEMWSKMLKNFLEKNKDENDISKDGETEDSEVKKSEEDTSRSFDD